MTTVPKHLARHFGARPLCWDENETGDADRTPRRDEVTCEECLSLLFGEPATKAPSSAEGDEDTTVSRAEVGVVVDAVLNALRATGHRVIRENDEDAVRVPRRIAQYAAAYIGEADHQEALDVAAAIETALGGAR